MYGGFAIFCAVIASIFAAQTHRAKNPHRLSTLKEMDRLIIIGNGKIVEDGTPDELLKKENGQFKKMWDHQIKGFIIDD